MTVSVLIETYNGDVQDDVLDALAPQAAWHQAEVIVTHADPIDTARITARLPGVAFVRVPPATRYYQHKNLGFPHARGDIVVFLDADCVPSPRWLDGLLAPFADGARVVGGPTGYPDAPLDTALDFPQFAAAPTADGTPCVRNFFSNNVAFARDVFAHRPFPDLAPMFHGQCQVLALDLAADGIPIVYAPDATVAHARADGAIAWLRARLLRGADTVLLVPHVARAYAPRTARLVARLGPVPALGVFAARALTGGLAALRHGPIARGLAQVAAVTAFDSLGALIGPAAYRWLL